MQTADFRFHLPPELVAQHPSPQRGQSRLLVLRRTDGGLEHRRFAELPGFLKAGDVLVLNDSRVIPARLRGVNAKTGGKFEMLLLESNAPNDWWAMIRPGKSARVGTQILISAPGGAQTRVSATVLAKNSEGHCHLRFLADPNVESLLEEIGEVPLPPYIVRNKQIREDKDRYQTVFARTDGSVAAPTAGLHFTDELLAAIRASGVQICFVTLHVGPGTFLPVKSEMLSGHKMHEERFFIGEETVRAVNTAKKSGGRIVAAGTTTVRVLETAAARNDGNINVYAGKTDIFIFPPYRFQVVDALLTNFHLPCSTLLMLVSAFAAPGETRGRGMILSAYAAAIEERYRFFSYGDAMLIL